MAPLYMHHIHAVHATGERTSHWVGELPGGARIEWDSEITEDVPNRLIAWQITGKALTGTAGQIAFTPIPHRKATDVRVTMDFPPVVGALGTSVGMIFAHGPEQEVRENLRRFKELAETGEIATTEGQPSGARKTSSFLQAQQRPRRHPTQPLTAQPVQPVESAQLTQPLLRL